jgi:hypothetical protein
MLLRTAQLINEDGVGNWFEILVPEPNRAMRLSILNAQVKPLRSANLSSGVA